jgi:hypothetical protein
MKKVKTHLNKMKPLYMIAENNCRILGRYLGMSFGNYRFEIISDLTKYPSNVNKLNTGDTFRVPKEERMSGRITIKELTPAEQVLYGPKIKKG